MSDGFSSPPVGMKNRQNDIILVTPPQRLSLILVREVLVCVCVSACEQKVCWGSIEYPAFSFNFTGFYNACDFPRVLFF